MKYKAQEDTKKVRAGARVFLFSKTPDRLWGPLSLPFIGFCGPVFGVKWARVNLTTHILPSNAEIKNKWSCTSTPLTCLHDVDRDN